jgi:hypothetical protein
MRQLLIRLLPVATLFLTTPVMAEVKPVTPPMSFYWQLQGTINKILSAMVYDIEIFDKLKDDPKALESLMTTLKVPGRIVICYFSAGTFENWRDDALALQADHPEVIGRKNGWPGERWLDVRSPYVREMMAARIKTASEKGCHGVEPDNVDGYGNNTGFSLTQQDSIDYNNFLAEQAHALSLSIAFKNSAELAAIHAKTHDFAIAEECFKYDECDAYKPFIDANKAVMAVEYSRYSATQCAEAKSLKFTLGFYNLALDGRKYQPC